MPVTFRDVEKAIRECLAENKVECGQDPILTSCDALRGKDFAELPGLYVFFDKEYIYYVGESGKLRTRVYDIHCRAQFASDLAGKLVLYYIHSDSPKLQEIMQKKRGRGKDLKTFFEKVRRMLRREISNLYLVVLPCESLTTKTQRQKIEKCIKQRLNPLFTPP